jgi:6-phosphogluconolactonase
MAGSVIVSETPEVLSERVAAEFSDLVSDVLQRQDRFTLALAGGQTPKLFYSRLAKEPYKSSIPWSRLWIFWGDERCVPKDHPESNFRMASEALLQYVPVPPAHVFRMRGEDPPPSAAREYETLLKEVFKEQEWPHFDLVLLGLGPDGHTASLMPGTPAMMDGDRWVVGNVVRSLQTVRITMTFPVINHARHVWFLVTGGKKNAPFTRAQAGPSHDLPASLVHPEDGDLRWYVDKAVLEPNHETQNVPIRRPYGER